MTLTRTAAAAAPGHQRVDLAGALADLLVDALANLLARWRTSPSVRCTFLFGLTRSEMASMVRASSARVRSMSATSAS